MEGNDNPPESKGILVVVQFGAPSIVRHEGGIENTSRAMLGAPFVAKLYPTTGILVLFEDSRLTLFG